MMIILKKLLCGVIPSSKLRKRARNHLKKKKEKNENRRIGASYSVWDGEELLEASIKSIRNNVSYINVVWQRLSWHGNACNEGLLDLLNDLLNKGLIDELIEWEPDLSGKISHNQNELNKRNVGLDYVKKSKCAYFLKMDTDEFYEHTEFKKAINFVFEHEITHSFINQILYYGIPTYRKIEMADFHMPFLYKINTHSRLTIPSTDIFPVRIDPSHHMELLPSSKLYIFSAGEFQMHHMAGVRKNFHRKIFNSSVLNKDTESTLKMMATDYGSISSENYKDKGFTDVANTFKISI